MTCICARTQECRVQFKSEDAKAAAYPMTLIGDILDDLPEISNFSMSRIKIGSAVTAQAMPTPSTNCQDLAAGPSQPSYINMPAATMLPNSNGAARASPAVMVLSRRCSQAFFKSSSMPAIHTKIITAHQAMPFNDWTTGWVKTKA